MLSIPSYKNDDPNYRYKMPRLVAKVEGRGNGIKTNIVNMGDIARALKRPPDYPTKFCGTELGAQSKFDPTEGKAIVNGAHEQRDLQVLIDKFIEKFVLCGNCKLPEIDLTVRKSRVQYRCNACGNKGDSDNTHKLSAFILKNPPTVSESTIISKKTKSSRREEKLFKTKSKGEDVVEEKKKKKEKQKDEKTKISKSKSDKVKEDTSTVSSEFSEDKVDQVLKSNKKSEKKRVEVLHLNELEPLNYSSPEISVMVEQLESFLTAGGKLNHMDESIAPESFCEQIRLIQISQGLDDAVKFYLALAVLFAKQFGGLTSSSLKSRLKYLKPIAKTVKGANVLIGLQDFFYSYEKTPVIPEGFKAYAAVLYMFYDNDLVKADEIMKFFNVTDEKKSEKCPNSQNAFSMAFEASKPFLDWLNDSSEE